MPLRPTKAMVLAAGLGTRMRPLTDNIPKPLVKFAGRALIDHVLDRLTRAGIQTAVVNAHYKAEPLYHHMHARMSERAVPRIVFSDEQDRLLDTGGGVVRALPHFGNEAFIIHNSDSVWREGIGQNLERLIRRWDPDRMDSLLLLAPMAASLGFEGRGDFNVDGYGRISRRRAGLIAPFVFTGVSIAHPRLFKDAPPGAFSLNKLWDRAIEAGRLYGVRLEGTWMHIGTPDALADAERFISGERL